MLTKETLKQWMLEDGGGILYDLRHPGVFTGYITITPERAELMLENNTHNRKKKDLNITSLATVLENGLWNDNVAKLNFDSHMVLSDGQNRLYAVIKTGVTIRIMVTVGVDPFAQTVTDRRGARTLADDLAIAGVSDSQKVAALIRVHCWLAAGRSPESIIRPTGLQSAKYPDTILFQYYQENKAEISRMKDIVAHVANLCRALKINSKTLNVLPYLFDRINAEDAEFFWRSLAAGISRKEDDPIALLRARLISDADSKTKKLPTIVSAALIIKAWNLFEKGETTKQLKYTTGGAHPESFPEIYNPYGMATADSDVTGSKVAQTSLAMPAP